MKTIHYDAEGDILSITFADSDTHVGLELSDNIVIYYNPETEEPLKLILISYQAMLETTQSAIVLDELSQAPQHIQTIVLRLLEQPPLTAFLQLIKTPQNFPLASRLPEVFTPTAWQTVVAS